MNPALLFLWIWLLWIASWVAAASWSNRTERKVSIARAWRYRLPVLVGSILLVDLHPALRTNRLWHPSFAEGYALAGIAALGLLFTWWARLHLGRLWSSSVTRKEGHFIVDTGPYAIVRHPIYTGIILAVLMSAIAQATLQGLLGCALITAGLWIKARIEEGFLKEELDGEAYDAYRRRIPMLLPFGPH